MGIVNIVRSKTSCTRVCGLIPMIGLYLLAAADREALACSSFLTEKGGVFIAGRNLDSQKFTPGVVVVNKRGIRKESRSWNELGNGQAVPNPPVVLKGDPNHRDPSEPVEDDRFVNAAMLIHRGEASPLAPLDYGMKILEEMAWEGTQWSYVCDLTNRTIRFRTQDSPGIKELDFADFDFEAHSPVRMLDIHSTGEVGPGSFSDYTLELNRDHLSRKISGWGEVFTFDLASVGEDPGITPTGLNGRVLC